MSPLPLAAGFFLTVEVVDRSASMSGLWHRWQWRQRELGAVLAVGLAVDMDLDTSPKPLKTSNRLPIFSSPPRSR